MSTSTNKKLTIRNYHHGNLINELKKNAIKIIKSTGVSKLNLRTLAAKCGVSATSVYRHFASKEHLLASIAEEGFYELQEAMITAAASREFQNMGLTYIHFALQNPVKFNLMFSSTIEKNNHPNLVKASRDAYYLLREQISLGLQHGLMQGEIESVTRTAWATVHGAALLLLDNQFLMDEKDPADAIAIAKEVTAVLGVGILAK